MYPQPPQEPRQKIPKDGLGPRGVPDCYYTSRVLTSTYRYARFVKRLRAIEEEVRKGNINQQKAMLDRQTNEFFMRCDRKSLINDVARRVDLCLQAYQRDLETKRGRLRELISAEERENIRKFVVQAQAGNEALWQEKLDRLAYLKKKRQKEHEEKYKETPITKATHITPCLVKYRAMEAQDIQLFQMREKQAKKLSERELDKMWHEVAMRESEALAARMELDAMERTRRDRECTEYSDMQLKMKREQQARDREHLRQETLMFKALWEEDNRREQEAEEQRTKKRMDTAKERMASIQERRETLAKQQADQELIGRTWDSLAGQGLQDELNKIALMKRKERELDVCNRHMIKMKAGLHASDASDNKALCDEAQKVQDMDDKKRCDFKLWQHKTNTEVRKHMLEQIKEHQDAKITMKKIKDEEDALLDKVFAHTSELCAYKEKIDAQARKKHQNDILAQIEYNKLLKERARQEELAQIKKYEAATEDYKNQIAQMMQRPFFSDEIHPFMKQMGVKKLEMREKCPCSKPDHCK